MSVRVLRSREALSDTAIRPSVPWRSCLGYRHSGCLQLSHRRPPEICRLRTRPRTDVDLPRFLPPSNCHIVSPSLSGAIPCWCWASCLCSYALCLETTSLCRSSSVGSQHRRWPRALSAARARAADRLNVAAAYLLSIDGTDKRRDGHPTFT